MIVIWVICELFLLLITFILFAFCSLASVLHVVTSVLHSLKIFVNVSLLSVFSYEPRREKTGLRGF